MGHCCTKTIIDMVNGAVTMFDWVQNWAPTYWNRWNSPTAPIVELAQRVSGRKNREYLYIESSVPGAASERAKEP